MSKRSDAADEILYFLNRYKSRWTEKHGIVVSNSLNSQTGGIIARKITFGIEGELNATVWIWSHDSIEIKASGKFYAITGPGYKSASAVIRAIYNIVLSATR
jgi:hypothetical protein